jgi:hypothetical protein
MLTLALYRPTLNPEGPFNDNLSRGSQSIFESELSKDLPSSKLLALASYTHHTKIRKTRYHITSHSTEDIKIVENISEFCNPPTFSSLEVNAYTLHPTTHHSERKRSAS